jgi:hypothetical protein
MQIMPATGRELGLMTPADLLNPEKNIDAGTRYLAQLSKRYAGDPDQAYKVAAAYNAGPGRVPRHSPFTSFYSRLPRETRDYVQKVVGPVESGSSSTALPSPPLPRAVRFPTPVFTQFPEYSSLFDVPVEAPQSALLSSIFDYLSGGAAQPTIQYVDPVMLALRSFAI